MGPRNVCFTSLDSDFENSTGGGGRNWRWRAQSSSEHRICALSQTRSVRGGWRNPGLRDPVEQHLHGFLCVSLVHHQSGRFFGEAYTKPLLTLLYCQRGLGASRFWSVASLLQTIILLALLTITFCPIVYALGLTVQEAVRPARMLCPHVSPLRSKLRAVLSHAKRHKLIELMSAGGGRRGEGPVFRTRRNDARIKVLFFESGRLGGSVFGSFLSSPASTRPASSSA